MLALTRKARESIVVDGPAEIFFTRIRGGKVRVSVKAKPEVKILRGELVDAPPDKPERKAA